MAKSNSEMSENSRFFGSITSSASFRSFLPKSKQKANSVRSSKVRSDGENVVPIDRNIQIEDLPLSTSVSFAKRSPSKVRIHPHVDELTASIVEEKKLYEAPDPPVKVVVRIRPAKGLGIGDNVFNKVSKDSLSVGEKKYTFDSVLDPESTQGDVYELIGAPLVKDALSGYNTSVIAYGQTGSGKTYTMWGPPSAMVEGASINGLHGLVPRIFQNLFLEIQREQGNSDGKQMNYQCRCSFLEIYDEKIGDLLDPTQRDLEIKDDAKNGFYVENLTEEYVTCYEDVTQILIKGLSNRKIGATAINSKSSRSHIVFTCITESWCKESNTKGFGSSKTSRICLVDLAGCERNVLDVAGRQHVKEQKYIKKSMSRLGCLVSILAEGSQSGKAEDAAPYRSSRLTHLLRESFGGNAKLSLICAISQENKNRSETISTLRFGLRAKLIKNEPVVNVITEDDVNGLSDQIRLLKEELMRAKSSDCFSHASSNFGGRNARKSLNQLRMSLNRSLILPCIDDVSEESLCIDEDDVKELKLHIDNIRSSHEETSKEDSDTEENTLLYSAEGHFSFSESDNEEIDLGKTGAEEMPSRDSLDIQGPVLSESPKIKSSLIRSSVIASNDLPIQEDAVHSSKILDAMRQSHQTENIKSSLRSSRLFAGQTESLKASLQRGLQIIDLNQKNSTPAARSSASFSFEHLALGRSLSPDKANVSVQNLDDEKSDMQSAAFICTKCEGRAANENELSKTCKDQEAHIEQLKNMLEQCKCRVVQVVDKSICRSSSPMKLPPIDEDEHEKCHSPKLLKWDVNEDESQEIIEKCEITVSPKRPSDSKDKEELLREIETLKNELQFYTNASTRKSSNKLRSSLLSQSMQLRKSFAGAQVNNQEDFEKEREKWMEMESEWISLTDDLRIEIEQYRHQAEKVEMELVLEKKCTEELDDALKRSVLNHARMIEHYAELQETHNDVVAKYRALMEGIADVKRAASKAGEKGSHGSRFAKALSAELSTLRMEREREREMLKKENHSLKMQLKDTAEAVHAAGELLVRLREAEDAASQAEEKNTGIQEDNEKLRKQIEKLKRKHKMEMITMKQYLAESRLPEAALAGPQYHRDDSDISPRGGTPLQDDDQAWRAEFGAIYQEHY